MSVRDRPLPTVFELHGRTIVEEERVAVLVRAGPRRLPLPRPAQRPRPRLGNGGRVPAALERTARRCDGWTASFHGADAELPAKIDEYLSSKRGPGTLGAGVIVCREGYRAPTSLQAPQGAGGPAARAVRRVRALEAHVDDAARYAQERDDIAARSVVGSPEQCLDSLGRYAAMDADGVVLRVQPPGMPQANALRAIEGFGEVLGRLGRPERAGGLSPRPRSPGSAKSVLHDVLPSPPNRFTVRAVNNSRWRSHASCPHGRVSARRVPCRTGPRRNRR
ncbi:hypothetical protein ACFYT4_30760 [Streptomyces sp. NPDC004609]|uniref:hypothetical protein n=1 Tax=Streptomyces sp. NPDC004609 TaxID=3364704 RepID=UPI0036B4FD89